MKNIELKEKIKAALGADPLAGEIESHIDNLEEWLERLEQVKWVQPLGEFVPEADRERVNRIGMMAVDMLADIEQSTHAEGYFNADHRGMMTAALGLAYHVLLREWKDPSKTMIENYVAQMLKNVQRMDVVGSENPS